MATESGGKVQLLSSIPALDTFTSAGMEVINDEGEFDFNTEEAAAIIEKYADAYAAGAMPAEALTGDYGGNAEAYIRRRSPSPPAAPASRPTSPRTPRRCWRTPSPRSVSASLRSMCRD